MNNKRTRVNISTNTPSEKRVGYSRAVIVDRTIYFSGTTSVDEKGNVAGKTVYEQTDFIIKKIEKVLKRSGFKNENVVLVRAYLTDMKNLSEFDKAFKKHFSKIKPCATVLGVSELVNPDLLIEIECIAEK